MVGGTRNTGAPPGEERAPPPCGVGGHEQALHGPEWQPGGPGERERGVEEWDGSREAVGETRFG